MSEQTIICERCDEEMISHTIRAEDEELTYETCTSCRSLFLDKGELDRVAHRVEGSIEYSTKDEVATAEEAEVNCPVCENQPMKKVHFLEYTDVLLDVCPNCEGFWLDEDNLEDINDELNKIMDTEESPFADFIISEHIPLWEKKIKDVEPAKREIQEAPPLKGAERVEQMSYPCPACSSSPELERYQIGDINFEACPECRGVWLNQGELRELKKRKESDTWLNLRWLDDDLESLNTSTAMDAHRPCPECDGVELYTARFGQSEVLIDICPECNGRWLDRNEFDEIANYLKQKLVNMETDEALNHALQELKEIWTGPEGTVAELKDAAAAVNAFICISIYNVKAGILSPLRPNSD